jgi:hypothetical protein
MQVSTHYACLVPTCESLETELGWHRNDDTEEEIFHTLVAPTYLVVKACLVFADTTLVWTNFSSAWA